MRKDYTLLYTDVVDSTAVNARLGDAGMATLWGEHDRLSRELLRQWHGIEIDRSDGFLVLFDSPPDAVAFIVSYHRLLATLPVPLRARAGIHVGPLVRRESLPSEVQLGAKPVEVVGIAKAIAARLMALAQGGQTLMSPSARSALEAAGGLDGPWRSVSHGHWRLKGLDNVVELFEVGDAHSAFVPPPDGDKAQRVVQMAGAWVGVREVPHNLPGERDSFVGRSEELKTLAQRFTEGARLLTVCGPGGMGKTRLALRYAWSWLGDHPEGLWFCDLSSARGLDGLLHAVGQGLDVPLGNDPVAQLGRAIAGRGRCLLILDNFEQLRPHARDTLGCWLDAAPQARFIVTSREVLGLPGESMLSLAPLPADDAALLFHQRARSAHALHDPAADPQATRKLVDLLDGMPLAIELAAPRVRVMPTAELLARMGDRFRLLAARSGRPDRQATLRATLAWSWELLSPDERAVLAQLAIFEGGFAWPAVQAVVRLGGNANEDDSPNDSDEAPWIIDLLQSLVDKSLVAPRLGARFNLLRSVREFALEELATEGSFPTSGQVLKAQVRLRHARHFASLTETQAIAGRCTELDNLVRACENAAADGQADEALACLRLSWSALRMVGPFVAGADLAAKVQAMPQLQPRHRLWAEQVEGLAHLAMGNQAAARAAAERALAAVDDHADRRGEIAAHVLMGEVALGVGSFETAETHLGHALALAHVLQDNYWRRWVLNAQGASHQYQSQYRESRACYTEALAISFDEGSADWQAALLNNLAGLHGAEGHWERARVAFEQSLELAREAGSQRFEGNARCNLGLVYKEMGRLDQAADELALALATAQRLGYARLAHVVSCNLGLLAEAQGDWASAMAHYSLAAEGARHSLEARSEAQYNAYLALALCMSGQADKAEACIGRCQTLLAEKPGALHEGMLACSQAVWHQRSGRIEAGHAAMAHARAIAAEHQWNGESELGLRISSCAALML